MSGQWRRDLAPMGLLFALLMLSLYLLGLSAEDLSRWRGIYGLLIVINLIALAGFSLLVARQVIRLVSELRRDAEGSRLTTRLVLAFCLIAIVPVSIIYAFSVRFIHVGINTWFDVRVEQALEQALTLSRQSLGAQMRTFERLSNRAANNVAGRTNADLLLSLNEEIWLAGANEMTVIDQQRHVLATTGGRAIGDFQPNLPDETAIREALNNGRVVALDSLSGVGLVVRTLTLLPATNASLPPQFLNAVYAIGETQNNLAEGVQEVYTRYRQITYLREPIKWSFVLTLSLALLLSLVMAIWVAFVAARRLLAPVRELAHGTQAVARGDYRVVLPQASGDELGFLVDSFNAMTQRLEVMHLSNERSQRELDTQRRHLQAVLSQLSAGVLVIDGTGRVRSANRAASELLDVPLADMHRARLSPEQEHSPLAFLTQGRFPLDDHSRSFEREFEHTGRDGVKTLVCRGTPLTGEDVDGWVLVFDDISPIVRAQRDAAWSEVARRLAHEIKNPLTPIQLAAERLSRRLQGQLSPADALLLSRSTKTIVQQVETLKSMVNDFADYANAPQPTLKPCDIAPLLCSVIDLYRASEQVTIRVDIDETLPQVEVDLVRMRQLLLNLVKNAIEAVEGKVDSQAEVYIQLCASEDTVTLTVDDNGPGFPEEFIGRICEPYVTTKPRGTGLGLAVVRQIAEAHHALLQFDRAALGGARVRLLLPVAANESKREPA